VLDVVRYRQWGYFFLLSNLKVIGVFNSDGERDVRIYPDCLDDVPNPSEDLHCAIISHVYKCHFHNFHQFLIRKGKIYTKRLNCTVDNLVQYKDTLAVRLRLQL
jgi:hypothetical protein